VIVSAAAIEEGARVQIGNAVAPAPSPAANATKGKE
jgi:hypothetical protein